MKGRLDGPAGTALLLLGWLALSVAWTWPLATDPLHLDIARQVDQHGLRWLSAAAAGLDGTRSDLSAWPAGQSLAHADSFVFLLLARLLAPFAPPTAAPAACLLLGPVLSAWAAEGLARRLGAARPWSALAGLAWAWGGVGALAQLEGQSYLRFDPWSPLCLSATFALFDGSPIGASAPGPARGFWASAAADADGVARSSAAQPGVVRAGSRARWGALLGAVGAWTLALLTSAYVALGLLPLVGAVALHGARREGGAGRAAALAGACALPCVAYAAWFVAAGESRAVDPFQGEAGAATLASGSATLATLLTRPGSSDLLLSSQGALLPVAALVLASFAPRVLGRGRPAWMPLLAVAGVLVLLSFGPVLRTYAASSLGPWLLAGLGPVASWFRFPVRLLHAASLAIAVVGAVVLAELARSAPRRAAALLVGAVVEAFVAVGMPGRNIPVPTVVPSAYAAAPEGWAVLDLTPVALGTARNWDIRWSRLYCGYAALHRRPVLSDFAAVAQGVDHRNVATAWLLDRLVGDPPRPAGLAEALRAVGVGAIALHPDLFAPADAGRVQDALELGLGGPTRASRDAGDRVLLWALVEGGSPPDRATRLAAWEQLAAGGLP